MRISSDDTLTPLTSCKSRKVEQNCAMRREHTSSDLNILARQAFEQLFFDGAWVDQCVLIVVPVMHHLIFFPATASLLAEVLQTYRLGAPQIRPHAIINSTLRGTRPVTCAARRERPI